MPNWTPYATRHDIFRIDKIIGLFCRISSLLYGSFAKETYDFKEPTNRSHPIIENVSVYVCACVCVCVCLCVRKRERRQSGSTGLEQVLFEHCLDRLI